MTTQNIFDLVDTWNDGATTFTAVKMDVTDTASNASSLLMDLQVGGSSRFNVGKTGSLKLGVSPTGTNQAGTNVTISGSQGTGSGAGGSIIFQVAPAGGSGPSQNALAAALTIGSNKDATFGNDISCSGNIGLGGAIWSGNSSTTGYTNAGVGLINVYGGLILGSSKFIAWVSAANLIGTQDLILARDDANKLALRNGTTAQRFNVYNTYTSSTNYEVFKIDWITTANTVLVGTEKGSVGGTARALEFQTDGVTRLSIATNGSIGSIGYLAVQPSGFTNASILDNSGNILTVSSGAIGFSSSATNAGASQDTTIKRGGASGVILLGNGTTPTDFSRLQFGGTSASFPAIKRNGAGIDVVGADGTNVSFVRVPGVAVASLPSASTAGVGARSFVTDATATTYASTVAGSGGNKVPVFSDGTNWLIG